jgi:ribonuclease T1
MLQILDESMKAKLPRTVLCLLLATALALASCKSNGEEIPIPPSGQESTRAVFSEPARAAKDQRSDESNARGLPLEARETLNLIRQGGPFPYAKDGAVFGNREGLLPQKPRGYYHEYTVNTPGARDRGARRIISGAGGELYYTDDHYRSFRRIRE